MKGRAGVVFVVLAAASLVIAIGPRKLPAITLAESTDGRQQTNEDLAIRKLVASGQAGWNSHAAAAMDKDFVEDCDFVNVFGEWICGREKLLRIHTALFAGPLRESYMRMTVEKIRFVRQDIAIVHVRERNTDRDGKPLEGDEGNRLLLVMLKERARWWILAGQNTQVKALPEVFKPQNSPAL